MGKLEVGAFNLLQTLRGNVAEGNDRIVLTAEDSMHENMQMFPGDLMSITVIVMTIDERKMSEPNLSGPLMKTFDGE